MSQTEQQELEQDKSMDKKEIAEEEREKMLNAENTKHTGTAPAPNLEAEEQKPKNKVPFGGIKMAGFCRTKSKEPSKDEDTKPTEGGDAETATKEGEQNATAEKPTTPAKDTKEKEPKEKETKEKEHKGFLDAIRLPLVSVFPRKKKEADAELGTAGLASAETLDDAGGKNAAANEDGMETVRLDGEANDGGEPPKQHPFLACVSAARRNLLVTLAAGFIALAVLVIICFACAGSRRNPSQPVKDGKYVSTVTSCGNVEGVLEEGAFVFRGIPYAVPPVGDRRWQPAELINKLERCWNGTYYAHNVTKPCWQRNATGHWTGDEDCMYLDVYTPKVKYDNPLPVVVLIGADTLLGPSPGIMVPSGVVARVRDMIFVRPNFRMGIFGFLAADPLSSATHPITSGNYGLSDIIAALQWVQLNIENFGGDKKLVTVWGHRAGGTLVSTLIGSRKTKAMSSRFPNPLFTKAWISSGSAIFPGRDAKLKDSEKRYEPFLTKIRCSDATCLRNKKPMELIQAVPESWTTGYEGLPDPKEATAAATRHEWLVLDGQILQQPIGEIFGQTNEELPVKIMMGTTAQSGTPAKLLAANATVDAQQVEKAVRESLLGSMNLVDKTFEHYNKTLKGLASMISDIRVVCPQMTVARMRSNIPFYVSTFPRINGLADQDADAAAILGFFPNKTAEQKRHIQAMQQLFNHFVWQGAVKDFDPEQGKRVLVVDQDVLPSLGYPSCDYWIKDNIVPLYGRVD